MDHKEFRALRKLREKIIDDLDPKYILDYLLSKQIVSEDHDILVRAEVTPRRRAKLLLDILPKCGSKAFTTFIESLKYDKNYPWLAKDLDDEIKQQNCLNDMTNNTYHVMLRRGGVPRLGPHHVNRFKEMDEVKAKLKEEFYNHGWVVLHGLTGCGKSTIAAAVISDIKFSEFYTAGVFWVTCGSEDGLLLAKMKALCEKLDKSYRNIVFDTIEVAKERLRELFSRPEYLDSLLVLDDVWNELVVDAFNVGCNTLVTTTDRGVFQNISFIGFVNVSPGFTQEQSLQLLAKLANMEVKELPSSAVQIHEICRGVPMLISAVGGYISDFPHDNEKWAICVRQLTRKRNFTGEEKLRDNVHQVIDLSFSYLSPELKTYYDTFAIFRDDVYIPREVLATFWGRSTTAVDEIMRNFEKKSLANRIWDDEGKTYLYTIHDLLLEYLKQKNISRIALLHKDLIDVYEKKCGGEWHLLNNDSYIFVSIGYHLHMAALKDIMKKIYFDFKFMKAKIENTMGCADLLYDYQKYFKDIPEPEFKKKLQDFIHFVRANSDLLSEKNCDFLQLALCQPETSEVYKQVKQLIPTCHNDKFYFDWCNKDNTKSACVSSCNIHKSAVRSAIFTPTGARVISCDNEGIIRIWDCNSVKQLSEICGHESRIRCCSFCVEHKILATCSADRTIKLWTVPSNFFEDQNGNSDDSNSDSPPTPFITKRWSNPLWTLEKYDESKSYYMMTFQDELHSPHCCAISNDGAYVVSGGNDGLILVWSARNGRIYKELQGHQGIVTCCQYSSSESILASGSLDGTVRLWNTSDYSEMKVLQGIDEPITSCCFLIGASKLVAASNHHVIAWDIESGNMEQLFSDCTQCQILTVAASDQFVAAGTAGYSIIVYSLEKKEVVNFFKGHKDWVRWVAFSASGDRLLSASEDKCIKVWAINNTSSSDLKLGDYCDASFTDDGSTMALVNLNNHVEITRDNVKSLNIESDDKPVCIKCCAISNKSKLIAICKDNGLVKVYSLKDLSIPVSEWKVHSKSIRCCEFSLNDTFLVTGSDDCCVGIVPLNEHASDQRLVSHSDLITQAKFFQSDERILSSSYDKTLVVWNVRTQTEIFKCIGHNESVVFCDISSDDKMIISASTDKSAILWDATDGRILTTYSHSSLVRSCRFLPNCTQVITGDDSGNITIWKVNGDYSASRVLICDHWVIDLIVSYNSKYLISASKNLRWWDVETGNCLQTFHTKGTNVHKVQASSDFSTVVCLDDAKVFYHLNAIQKPRDL